MHLPCPRPALPCLSGPSLTLHCPAPHAPTHVPSSRCSFVAACGCWLLYERIAGACPSGAAVVLVCFCLCAYLCCRRLRLNGSDSTRTDLNLVVVSDHGMAPLSPDRIIFIDDCINASQPVGPPWVELSVVVMGGGRGGTPRFPRGVHGPHPPPPGGKGHALPVLVCGAPFTARPLLRTCVWRRWWRAVCVCPS